MQRDGRYFRSSLTDLVGTSQRLRPEAEELATRGLDAEPILASLEEVGEAIVQTRSRVHTFDRGGFDQGAKVGREAVAKTETLIEGARKEQRYRRTGLLVSIGLMSFLAVVMGIRDPPARPAPGEGERGPAHAVRPGARVAGAARTALSGRPLHATSATS